MKRTIVVADRDESLQHAFMTVFSRDHFEIIYASTGKEVERIAERIHPDTYVVNVDLPKMNGIEVYKKLQKQRFLDTASFFFMKDESDRTELLGYQADGVIEKPLNFFRVYETVTREDEVIELTDLIDDGPDLIGSPPAEQIHGDDQEEAGPVDEKQDFVRAVYAEEPEMGNVVEDSSPVTIGREEAQELAINDLAPEGDMKKEEEIRPEKAGPDQSTFEERLREAMDGLTGGSPVARTENIAALAQSEESQIELEAQFKTVLNQALEEAALKLSARLAPILTQYVEDYVKRMLMEIAEKVIREEIDKLLKESTG